MVKLTGHSKERLKERVGVSSYREASTLFDKARKFGKAPQDIAPGPFKELLLKKLQTGKEKGMTIKVYDNIIFIYKQKTLITSYRVPDIYLGELKKTKTYKYELRQDYIGKDNEAIRKELEESLREMRMSCLANSYGFGLASKEELDGLSKKIKELCEILRIRLIASFKIKKRKVVGDIIEELDKRQDLLEIIYLGEDFKKRNKSIGLSGIITLLEEIHWFMYELEDRKYLRKEEIK